MKKLLVLIAALIVIVSIGKTYNLLPNFSLNPTNKSSSTSFFQPQEKQQVVYQESVVTDVVEKSLPSVVTIGILKTYTQQGSIEIDPFNLFGPFRRSPSSTQKIDQNIGSGFIVSEGGLIITNKHVVSDEEASYKVLTNDNKKYDVQKIYRDPLNDLAILKINATGLKALPLGDSSKLKLGQMAIAIGTPLGEFRNTVTTGIVSGLGRGITAGSPFEGYVEKLDGVIQTDAAISPGNSGGPLLNSKGQVIGVNAAIASEGQNIGFALPVNLVKELMNGFNKRGGTFERPYLGVLIDRKTAIGNGLVEGAYVQNVVESSPAKKAGIQTDDVITEVEGKKIFGTSDTQQVAKIINDKQVGDTIRVKIWRNGETQTLSVVLEAAP